MSSIEHMISGENFREPQDTQELQRTVATTQQVGPKQEWGVCIHKIVVHKGASLKSWLPCDGARWRGGVERGPQAGLSASVRGAGEMQKDKGGWVCSGMCVPAPFSTGWGGTVAEHWVVVSILATV
jgi:hypothetical protein